VSAEIDDGGPAFPQPLVFDAHGNPVTAGMYFAKVSGMPLRDWLAAHATEADIEEHRNYRFCPQTKCVLSRRTREAAKYAYADEMIRARKGGTDGDR
jgi:hypothetical protein